MDMVDLYFKMVIIMQVNLYMEKEMVLVYWFIRMVHHMKENGQKIKKYNIYYISVVMVKNKQQMEMYILDNLKVGKKMEKVDQNMQMEVYLRECLKMDKLMVKEHKHGQMEEDMKENGKRVR